MASRKKVTVVCNLKHVRDRLHLSKYAITKMLGWNQGQPIADWENGKTLPSLKTALFLAYKLGVNVSELFIIKENK